MKITTLLLITGILQVSATTYAQKITLSEKNASLKVVFNKIRMQSGYDFIVTKSALESSSPVNIEVKNGELKDVLEKIFKNQPLEYEVTDKFVNIKVKEKSFFSKVLDVILAKNINGRVFDENDNPLAGATITVLGTSISTTTTVAGYFGLPDIKEDATIRVSYVGYVSQDIKVTSDLYRIKLVVNESKLDEIKVIGYGTTSQRLSTGSVGTIKAADIEKQPVSNILDAMIGRIAGLQITQTSGIQGAAPKVKIRGAASINSGTDPLYILDGVPVTAAQALNFSGALDNQSLNLLNSLNTTDIESVTVLKDADATAIYGSRGANGVILITTKRGKAGKLVANVRAYTGIQQVANSIQLLSTDQYLAMRSEAFANDKIVPDSNSAPDLLVWDKNKNTNWQKDFIGKTAVTRDINLSLSGGSQNSNYYISGGDHREGSVMPGDSKLERKSFNANITNTSDNKKFSIDTRASYTETTLNLVPTDLTTQISLAPNVPIYHADGSPSFDYVYYPYDYLLQHYAAPTKTFSVNGTASYEFLPGLKLKLTGGFTNNTASISQQNPAASQDPSQTTVSTLALQNTTNDNWILEPQIAYSRNFKEHHIEALAGATFQKSEATSVVQNGSGFANDNLIGNIGSASVITTSSTSTPYSYNAFFGRISYDFNQEFLANITFRRDGSSRFGDDHKFGNFGAVGLGWVFTQEKVITDALPFLSYGKLRGSYGLTGNDQIGNFQYLNTYLATGSPGYAGATSLRAAGIANPELQWETTKKLEAALEFGLFKDRILFTGAYFKHRSDNQLVATSVSPQTGFFSFPQNFPGVIETKGYELELTTKNIQSNFTWNTNFTFSKSNNKLVAYPAIATSTYKNTYVVGQSLSIIQGYKFAGLNTTGVPTYTYANGTVGISPGLADRVILGNKDPMYGSISNEFGYKGFTFSFFVRYDRNVGTAAYYPNNVVGSYSNGNGNRTTFVLGRWQKPGDEANTNIPRFTTNTNLYNISTYLNSDALVTTRNIVRLSNAALAFNLPSAFVSKLKMSHLQVYTNAQNLFVFDKYRKYELDPQTGNNYLPPLRTIVFGINASF